MSSDYVKRTMLADEVRKAEVAGAVESVLAEPVAEPVEEVRDKQVLIRVSESQRDQWQECAEADGLSVSSGCVRWRMLVGVRFLRVRIRWRSGSRIRGLSFVWIVGRVCGSLGTEKGDPRVRVPLFVLLFVT